MKERLIPFEKLASEIHPTLKLDSALIQLQEDFKRLEEITSKYEFIPLNDDVKVSVLQKLRPIAKRFSERQFEIEITHETWVNAPTQKYTLQLKSLLEKAGFKVLGPRQITVFLVQRSYPVELGFSPSMAVEANGFLEALLPIFTSTNGWSKRDFQEERKTLRFHIGGGAIFKKNGVVTIE